MRPGKEGPGFHVFTPLETADGRILFVNRGFVPERLKDPASRAAGQPQGEVEVTGLLRRPAEQGWFTPANEPARNLWFWRDLDGMAASVLGRDQARALPFFLDEQPRDWPSRRGHGRAQASPAWISPTAISNMRSPGTASPAPSSPFSWPSPAPVSGARLAARTPRKHDRGRRPAARSVALFRTPPRSTVRPFITAKGLASCEIRQHAGRRARAWLRGRSARRPCARRRPLCPRRMALAVARRDRRLRRPALRRCRPSRDLALRRQRHPRRRARTPSSPRPTPPSATPPSRRWCRSAPTIGSSSSSTARRSPSRTCAMQVLARLMDRALARRGRARRPSSAPPPATPAAPPSRPSAAARRIDVFILYPAGPRQRRAAPADDDAVGSQRARHRHRGHVRRLPGSAEGAVQRPRRSATGSRSPASIPSTGPASSPRSSTTSPPPRRSARPHRP